jgi:hypothetical protein
MRAALGVVVALVVMSVVVFAMSVAPWLILGVDTALEPGRFVTVPAYDVYAVVVGALGAALGGWLCIKIGRSRLAVIVLAVLSFAGGMTNAYAQHAKPAPGPRAPGVSAMEAVKARQEPAWFTLLMPCLGVVGVLLGGRGIPKPR